MRAAIYTRISADREGAGLGVQSQEHDCRELAASLGASIVAVHTDNDLSAYSGKPRPGYQRLIDDIRAGRIDLVLAWHTDRLHRSPVELEQYVDLCEQRGVQTHTVKAGRIDLSTPSGRLVARQLGSVARYEVEHAVERMQRAKLRSATAGKWKGGRRPFGYADDGITIVEPEAQAIREATAAVLAGASILGLAREWRAQGLRTTTGKAWDGTGVRRTLLRPRNAGLMEHRGEIVGNAEWPALVHEEEWRAVVRILTDEQRRTSPGSAPRWLGSGLYRCGICGGPCIGSKSNGRAVYRCREGGHVSRNARDVDRYVSGVIVERLRRPDFRDALAAPRADVDVPELERLAVTLRDRLDNLATLYASGDIDARQFSQATRSLNGQLDATRQQIADAYSDTALEGIADAPDPGAAWLNSSLDRRRAVLAHLIHVRLVRAKAGRPEGWTAGSTYFDPRHVEIRWIGQQSNT